jgi:hypothetical protein
MPLRFEMTLSEGLLMELLHRLMLVSALSLVFGTPENAQVTSKPNNRDDDAGTQGGFSSLRGGLLNRL